MEVYHCPAAEINKQAHADFLEKFDKIRDEYNQAGGSADLALKIHEEIFDWIVNHVIKVDGQLYSCIHNKPNSRAGTE